MLKTPYFSVDKCHIYVTRCVKLRLYTVNQTIFWTNY
jgi:hypothetical protein